MGLRFQKRIKICDGLHVNLSKSGVGWSIGPKGLKMSTGPSGTFLHASAVGTGLYYRKKLSPNKSSRSTSTRTQNYSVDESDLRELARLNGFLLVPDPDKAPEEEPCPEPMYHSIVGEDDCHYCNPDVPAPPVVCFYCEKPLKPGQTAWHGSCNWINDHQLLILFGVITGAIFLCAYLM